MKRVSVARRGFGLVEVLVALAVLAVGIYGVYDLVAASQKTAVATDVRVHAGALARLKLEELCAAPAAELAKAANGANGGEAVFPAEGPAKFAQDGHFQWRAFLQKDEQALGPVLTIRVEVDPVEVGAKSAMLNGVASPAAVSSGVVQWRAAGGAA